MSYPTVELGEVVDVLSGFAFKSKQFGDAGDLPIARIRDVTRGFSQTYYTGEYAERFVINDGDTLIGMDGEFNRARWQGGRALLNQRVCKVTPANGRLDDKYLFHFLPPALKAIERETSFVTVKHLSAKRLKAVEIPLPPIEEQRRIAAVLDAADGLRGKRREALAKLDTLTQAIFIDMFGDAGSAKWAELAEVAEVQGGLQVSSKRKSNPVEVPYLRVANVFRGRIDLTEVKTMRVTPREMDRTVLQENDLLVVEGHGNKDEIGRVGRWAGEIEPCVHQNHLICVRCDVGVVLPRYVEGFMNSEVGRRALLRAANTTSGLNTISTIDVRSVRLPVPSLARQIEFANRLDHVDAGRDWAATGAVRLDDLLASLQQRAFRGEL